MKINNFIYSLILITSSSLFAQETIDSVKVQPILPKLSVLDSIKKTFVNHNEMTCIDSLWMKELSNQELAIQQFDDIKNINLDANVAYDLPTDVLKERLKKLDEKSPFNIEYNPVLENVIKGLLKNRTKSYERLMAISEYYFPLFEDALAKYNIPIEVKYLAIIESALNPKIKSRVGATGLWQFMYGTGIQYNLEVNSYVDERSDPIKATEAACKYLSGMYTIFGDWDLVLASYNCGPGNVTKAIRRSGGQKNYWNIRKNLPKETAGYLPMFLATMYIFEYHKEHGINPMKAPANYFATDTIEVKHQLSFKQISNLIDVPLVELEFLNPSYKLDVIPFVASRRNYVRLPLEKVAVFTSNEDKIYYYANYEANLREKPYQKASFIRDTLNKSDKRFVTRYKYHKVKRGDNLDEIASKYGVTTTDIKKWNKLKNNNAPLGRNLKILETEKILSKEIAESKPEKPEVEVIKQVVVASAEPEKTKETFVYKEEKVVTYKDVTKTYKVKKGDNLSEIADKYDVSMADIKKWNKIRGNSVAKGQNLKIITNEKVVTTIRKKEKKETADKVELVVENETKSIKDEVKYKEEKVISFKDVTKTYKVKKGDNLGEIADKNNVSVAEIKKWNNLKNNNVPLGKNLKIITNEKVVTTIKKKIKAEIADKTEAIVNNEPKEIKTKKIQKSDTIVKSVGTYIVQSGDNLSSISRKHNISVNELKELNNLESNNLILGSKLIISKSENQEVAENQETKTTEYTVAKGDNVWTICKKFNLTLAQLKAMNNLENDKVLLGSKLVVTKSETVAENENQSNSKKKSDKLIAKSKEKEKLYFVKKGDSLFSISQKYQITVSDLKKWNDIRDGNIKPGMKLKISG
jgi:membrane-bound lytic murein transglycosylase D